MIQVRFDKMPRLKKIFVLSVFSMVNIFFLFSFSVMAQSRAVIRFAAASSVENDRIALGEVAEISGAGQETIKRLKMISLGYAPNVGMTRELYKDRILLAIAAAGFHPSEFTLHAPPAIVVRRASQTVSPDALRAAVEKAILDDFKNQNVAAKIVRLDVPPNLQIPLGKMEIRANAANIANFFAPFSVSLEIRVAELIVRRVSVTAQVEAAAEVLIAGKNFSPGDKITESDVRTETRRLEKPLNNYLRDAGKLRGAVLLKNLSAGAEITIDAIAAGYVVRAGDTVRIVGESGKTRIIVNGEARSSGRIGDRISVKNSQSGAILQAVVVDAGSVKILF